MKLRWSHRDFKCKCGAEVKTGELSYLRKCCETQVCKVCGEEAAILKTTEKPLKKI